MVAGDLNRDGWPDLVMVDTARNVVSVRLAAGGLAYGAPTDYPVGLGPRTAAIGDLNGDGALDVVVANADGHSCSVLLGNGTGGLGAATTYTLSSDRYPQVVRLEDLDRDSDLDICLSGKFGTAQAIVLPGNGDGTFGDGKVLGSAGNEEEGLAVADLNGDGRLDLLTADSTANDVSVFLGDTTAPTGVILINGGAEYTNTTSVLIDCTGVAGAAEMRFCNQGGDWSSWGLWQATKSWTLTAGDGTKTVEAEFRDAGHNTLAVSDSIELDTAPPSGTMVINGDAVTTASRNVTLNSSVTGATEMQFRDAGGTWSGWETYAAARPWTISGPDGDRVVEAEYRDAALNVLDTSDHIVLDTTPPSTVARNDATGQLLDSSQWWRSPLQVRLTGSDSLSGVATITYRLDGGPPQVASGSGLQWSTSLAVIGEPDHSLEYWSVDAAGNEELPHHTLTVHIDDTPPNVSVPQLIGTHGLSDWYISPVTVRLTGSDARSGLAGLFWSLSGPGSWTLYNDASPPQVEWQGQRPFYYRAVDNVGWERWSSQTIKIDTHDPNTDYWTDETPSSWGWYKTIVHAELRPMDDGSGPAQLNVSVDHPTPYPTWTPYPDPEGTPYPVTLAGEGTHTLQYYAQDTAGRQETVRYREVKIDMTPPETTTNCSDSFFDAWHDSAVSVGLIATDGGGGGGGAGVAYTQGQVDGAGFSNEAEVEVPAPPDGDNDGLHVVQYRAMDMADNYETARTCSVKIDTTAPRTTDDAPGGACEEEVVVTLTPRDDPPESRTGQLTSGVASTEYSIDGGSYLSGDTVDVPAPPDGDNDGLHTIRYHSTDNAGNEEEVRTCTVLIDTSTLDVPPPPWRAQGSGTTDTLRGVVAVTDKEAWAVGLNGRVLRTTDGGQTWEERDTGTTQSFFDVYTTGGGGGAGHGCWVVGAQGKVLHSTDGGASWNDCDFTTANLYAVAVVDPETVWVAGAGGLIARSSDGGGTWEYGVSGTAEPIYDLSFFDEERGWACGYDGTILATADGGATWEKEESGTTQTLRSISFFDGLTGIAVGANGTMLRTTDGGTTWTSVSVTSTSLFGVHTCGGGGSGAYGGACGAGGLILFTSDAGQHWVSEPSGTTNTLYAADFTPNPIGWAVGDAGTLLNRDPIPPETGDDAPAGWQREEVTVHLTPSDVGSGVAGTSYSVDGGGWGDGRVVVVPAPSNGANDGTHTISYRSTDNAGNEEEVRTCEVRIDTQPPETTDNHDTLPHQRFVLRLEAHDSWSDACATQYRLDGGSWQSGTSLRLVMSTRHRVRLGPGVHTIEYYSTDSAGNVEEVRSCQVILGR